MYRNHAAFAEHAQEAALHLRATREQQQFGSRHVQAVHDKRVGECFLNSRGQAPCLLAPRSSPAARVKFREHSES